MGKAAILLVLATGLAVTYGLMSSIETGHHTARHQASFEERVLAREIARSGFNLAMGILRQHGDDLQAGVLAVNGSAGYLEGESQGGVYRARARYLTGHSVEVISTGYFGGQISQQGAYQGGASHTLEDNFSYRVTTTPLRVKECSRLNVKFIQSMAGYCSAVYMQRYLPDVAPEDQPAPEMIFAPGQNRNNADFLIEKLLTGDTQMNFFIGVDQNCDAYGNPIGYWRNNNLWASYDVESHVFDPSNYNYIHYGFEAAKLEVDQVEETIWAMIEQHPQHNQRWRVSWEDMHNTSWDQPSSTTPSSSLQATKRFGYDGNGWPDTDSWGYRTLRDYPDRPDFSDQVVQVSMAPAPIEECQGGEAAGGGEEEEVWPLPVEEEVHISEWSEPDFSQPGCACPGSNINRQNHKVLIRHRPPGNPTNVQMICVARPGADAHLSQHDDSIVCERR
jgi:hypothetical protein